MKKKKKKIFCENFIQNYGITSITGYFPIVAANICLLLRCIFSQIIFKNYLKRNKKSQNLNYSIQTNFDRKYIICSPFNDLKI